MSITELVDYVIFLAQHGLPTADIAASLTIKGLDQTGINEVIGLAVNQLLVA